MNYLFFTDKNDNQRVMRIRYPAFLGTIVDSYSQNCEQASKSHNGMKICLDEVFDECPKSKLEWACKKALQKFPNQDATNPFVYIKKNREYLNISKIEEVCDIPRTSLLSALSRDQNKFKESYKLVSVVDKLRS